MLLMFPPRRFLLLPPSSLLPFTPTTAFTSISAATIAVAEAEKGHKQP